MSLSKYTQLVSPNACLGDSLVTFNSNFSALDQGLSRLPAVLQGPGVEIVTAATEQENNTLRISNKNSFVFGRTVDYQSADITNKEILLQDRTTLTALTFPYLTGATIEQDPYVTFSAITLTEKTPQVSIFWTTSGASDITLYATNSSHFSLNNSIEFNAPITALMPSGNLLYVGGEFTTVGGIECKKLCVIDLESGIDTGARGRVGTLITNPLSADGDLENFGTINVIKEYTSDADATESFLIVGGSFVSLAKGRSLVIQNKVTGEVYPFYVNGTIHDAHVLNGVLYIAGNFDYLNYGAQSVSLVSGLRVYSNCIAKILLGRLTRFPNSSIDKTFATNTRKLFASSSNSVNALASHNFVLYIGGTFDIQAEETLLAKNLASINDDGTYRTKWRPILIGEAVYTMEIDQEYFYVGGKFEAFYTSSEYYVKPRPTGYKYETFNAVCFNINSAESPTIEYNWKPKFNGAVTKLAFHDQEFGSFVYATGLFTSVNGHPANHIAAVEKSYENNIVGEYISWINHLQKPPYLINRGLVEFNNTILIGGTFNSVNSEDRSYLARLTRVDESLSATSLSAVSWSLGAQMCNQGSFYGSKFTNMITTSAYASNFGVVNETFLTIDPIVFKGSSAGQFVRFYLGRPMQGNTTPADVHFLGWKLNFN